MKNILWKCVSILMMGMPLSASAAGNNWMSSLNDNLPISQISIPGTHESGAQSEPVSGTAKCQSLTIANQLTAGVRFLDIRCRHLNDAFVIHHGSVYENMNFDDVLNAVGSFLSSNPSECVIMSVKEEYTASGDTRTFEATFDSYVAKNPSMWYLGSDIPTLGQGRGKIVLVRRFGASTLPTGIDASVWPDNTTFTTDGIILRVQDWYNVTDNNTKWNFITSLITEANAGGPGTIHLNFTSGVQSGAFGIPNIPAVSNDINGRLTSYLTANPLGRYGIIAMDFADATKCALVYNTTAVAVPQNLSATTTSANTVNLTWSASAGAVSYRVKRSPSSGGPYAIIDTVNGTSYTDVSGVAGITYYYAISGIRASGESADSLQAIALVQPFSNFSFETPTVANYQYNPTGSSWTFSGASPNGSGILANGSAFSNPSAPQGTQTAFVQELGTISQTLTGLTPGQNYTITFSAAQRPGSNNHGGESWNVTIDNNVVGTYNPGAGATSYVDYTANFTATATAHTVSFVGTNLATGDNTVFIDNVKVALKPLLPSGAYALYVRSTGQALDANGGASANDTPLIQSTYHSGANQQWNVNSLGNGQYNAIGVASGRAVEVFGASMDDNAGVNLFDWNGGTNQRWTLVDQGGGYYNIIFVHSGKAMQVLNNSSSNGALIVQASGNGTNAQWQFHAPVLSSGTYAVYVRSTGQALDVNGAATANGSALIQSTYHGGTNQQWNVNSLGNNQYNAIGVASGRVAEVYAASQANNAYVDIYDSNGGANQRWTLVDEGAGYYNIVFVHSGKAMQVLNNSSSNGASIVQYTLINGNGANAQWQFQAP